MFNNNKNILYLIFTKWLSCDRQWTECPAVGAPRSPNYDFMCLDTDENKQKLSNHLSLPTQYPNSQASFPPPIREHRFNCFEPYLRLALFLFLFVEFLGPTSFTASSQNPMLEFLVSALLQILTRSDAHWLGGPVFIEPQTEFPMLVCRLECC